MGHLSSRGVLGPSSLPCAFTAARVIYSRTVYGKTGVLAASYWPIVTTTVVELQKNPTVM